MAANEAKTRQGQGSIAVRCLASLAYLSCPTLPCPTLPFRPVSRVQYEDGESVVVWVNKVGPWYNPQVRAGEGGRGEGGGVAECGRQLQTTNKLWRGGGGGVLVFCLP